MSNILKKMKSSISPDPVTSIGILDIIGTPVTLKSFFLKYNLFAKITPTSLTLSVSSASEETSSSVVKFDASTVVAILLKKQDEVGVVARGKIKDALEGLMHGVVDYEQPSSKQQVLDSFNEWVIEGNGDKNVKSVPFINALHQTSSPKVMKLITKPTKEGDVWKKTADLSHLEDKPKSETMKMPDNTKSLKELLQSDPVPLSSGDLSMYQPTLGTSPGSRYFVAAVCDLGALSARYSAQKKELSLRFEKNTVKMLDPYMKTVLNSALSFQGPHWSRHFNSIPDVKTANRVLGAIVGEIGTVFDFQTVIPDLSLVEGLGC